MQSVDLSLRSHLIRAAILACGLSVAWALLVGIAAILAGRAAHSLALVGFGLDSAVDGTASAVLVWRFRVERREPERAHRVERTANRVVAVILLVVATYVAVEACRSLATRSEPTSTVIGISLAAASLIVLPGLAAVKLRLASQLQSRALRGDGMLSAAGAFLALVALLGLVLNNVLGWWWADSVAAMLVAAMLAVEGWRGVSRST
jgi:divalent metal cation (Fe/Co/Zn/Cd) transporter